MSDEAQAEPRGNRREHVWAIVGRVAAVIAAVGTVVGVAFAFWSTWTGEPRIHVEAERLPYVLPAPLAEQLETLDDAARYSGLPADTSVADLWWRSRTSEGLQEIVPPSDLDRWRGLRGLWILRVTNAGGRQADAGIQVPHLSVATVQREGLPDGHIIARENQELVEIGSIRPGQEITIYAWTGPYSSLRPSRYSITQDLKLYVSAGSGEIDYLWPVGPFWQWLAIDMWGGLKFTVWFLLIMFPIAVVAALLAPKLSSSPPQSTPPDRLEDESSGVGNPEPE